MGVMNEDGNPEHPVTKMMAGEWHKVAALLMLHFGMEAFEITPAMLRHFEEQMQGRAVVADCRGEKFVIRVMPLVEAARAAGYES